MADASRILELDSTFEIVSLTGTLEIGNSHLHMAVSDVNGAVIGGHVKYGCIVGITAEIVIAESDDLSFRRKFDIDTGYEELVVESSGT